MYLSILGNPTDKDLERYPADHVTGPLIHSESKSYPHDQPTCF